MPTASTEPWRRAGCHRDPSTTEPDPTLFFATPEARELHASLLVALRLGDGGLFIVTGEAGIGKTMLLRVFKLALTDAGETVLLHDCARDGDRWQERLDAVAGKNGAARVILLVDGAEHCDDKALDQLHQLLLPNPDRPDAARLVISGRPEIEPRLQRLADAALEAQIPFARMRLEPIGDALVGDFLMHRLWQSGFNGEQPLAPDALQRVVRQSGGVPRRIIDLAAAELAIAWRGEAASAAALHTPSRTMRLMSRAAGPLAAAAVLLAMVAIAAAWFGWQGGPPADRVIAAAPPPAEQAGKVIVPIAAPTPPADPVVPSAKQADALPPPPSLAQAEPPTPVRPQAQVQPQTEVRPQIQAALPTPIEPTPETRLPDPDPPKVVATVQAPPPPAAPPTPVAVADPVPAPAAAPAEAAATPRAVPDLAAQLADQSPAVSAETENESIMASLLAGATTAAGGDPTPPRAPSAAVPAAPVVDKALNTAQGPATVDPSPSAGPPAISAAQAQAYRERGDGYLQTGDIAAARLLYERAAAAGDARAMVALARTYDPAVLRQWGVVGLQPDPDRAAHWYRKAAEAARAATR